jgi:uncharacterized protein DUF5988
MFPAEFTFGMRRDIVMREIIDGALAGNPVMVQLVGGPASIGDGARVREVDAHEEKIKLPHQGGYEHFERAAETLPGKVSVTVFRWTMRTKAAE